MGGSRQAIAFDAPSGDVACDRVPDRSSPKPGTYRAAVSMVQDGVAGSTTTACSHPISEQTVDVDQTHAVPVGRR